MFSKHQAGRYERRKVISFFIVLSLFFLYSVSFLHASALVYSTFLGGNNYNQGYGIAVDTAGNAYVTGITQSPDFPTTVGAFDTIFAVPNDKYTAFVTKLNTSGSALVYSTFLGGTVEDYGESIAVDTAGNAYVTGYTESHNFPTTVGVFDTTYPNHINGNYSGFVTKLNASGSALVYSTFLGGNVSEQGYSIVVDTAGNAYVTGLTQSHNFPTTAGAFDTTLLGSVSAFVTKLNASGSALVYSTFLGGDEYDYGYGIAVDTAGNAYVTGNTESTNFPTTAGAFDTTYPPGAYGNVFVTKLNASGSALVYSTFLGGNNNNNQGNSIAVDTAGNAYVTGYTGSPNFPTTAGAFDTTIPTDNYTAFVTKLNNSGSALVYSTFLGGDEYDYGASIAVDTAGNAYVTGYTESPNFPTTAGAFDTTLPNYIVSAFVTKLNASGSTLVYSTFLGGNNGDKGNGIAVDTAGNAYVTGNTGSPNFPTTAGAFDTTIPNDNASAFVTKLNINLPIVSFYATPSTGNGPYTATFIDTSNYPTSSFTTFQWIFGDGNSTGFGTSTTTTYQYQAVSAPTTYTAWEIVSTSFGVSSSSQTISVTEPSPSVASLLTPLNNVTTFNSPLLFSWSTSTDIVGSNMNYILQLGLDSAFTSIVTTINGISSTSQTLSGLPNGVIYWHTKATSSFGTTGSAIQQVILFATTDQRVVTASETVIFYVGDTIGRYLPVQIFFTSTNADTVTVTNMDTTAPNLPTSYYIPRYWIITPMVTQSNLTATITFSYTSSDYLDSGVTLESDLVPSWDTTGSGGWTSILSGVTVDTVNHLLTVSDITHFSNWTLGGPNGAVPIELSNFMSENMDLPELKQ